MYHIDKTYFWIIFLTALGVTLLITPISILIAKKAGVMDIPKDERRVHNKPIPRMGGLGIYFGINTGYILAINLGLCDYAGVDDAELYGVFFGGTVMFIVGLIDDVRGMRPMVKLAGQIVSALIVFLAGVRVANIGGFIGGDITTFGGAVSLILTVIWIVAIANTINLIDGLDGLAAGVVAISTCCIAYVAYIHGNYHIACFTMLAMAGGFLSGEDFHGGLRISVPWFYAGDIRYSWSSGKGSYDSCADNTGTDLVAADIRHIVCDPAQTCQSQTDHAAGQGTCPSQAAQSWYGPAPYSALYVWHNCRNGDSCRTSQPRPQSRNNGSLCHSICFHLYSYDRPLQKVPED